MKIMCQKHEKLNETPCAKTAAPISNTPNIALDHGGVMCNFTLGVSSGNGHYTYLLYLIFIIHMKIVCPKHEKLNNIPCAEAAVPILNTSNIVLDPGGVMCNFTLGGS